MIARTWHGTVPAEQANAYHATLLRTGLADYASTPGNLGVLTLRRGEAGVVHFVLVTVWESLDAVRRYAGDDVLRARYYPEEDDFLIEKEPFVTQYDLVEVEQGAALPLRAAQALLAGSPGVEGWGVDPFAQAALERLLVDAGISVGARTADGASEPSTLTVDVLVPEISRTSVPAEPLDRLLVRERGRIVPVRLADVVRLEAQGDYALLHTRSGAQHLAYLSLNAFEARPDTTSFLRVHRSHVVNLDFVRAFVPHDAARLAVELADGTVVVASRSRSTLIRRHAC